MAIPRVLAFSLAVVVFLPGGLLLAEEAAAADKQVFSKHIKDAILAGFRKGDPEPQPAASAAPLDVAPEVLVLPGITVTDGRGSGGLTRDALTPKTEAVPLVAGTGVTEFKGKKFTVKIQRILYIPIAFKISW